MQEQQQWIEQMISRRAFLGGMAGLASIAIVGCETPHKQSLNPIPPTAVVMYYNKPTSYHETQLAKLPGQGYRIISLSIYGDPASPLYAVCWAKQPGPAWHEFHGITAGRYQSLSQSWTAQGSRPTILTATGSADNAIFAGVVEKDTTAFIAKYGLVANADTQLTEVNAETQKATVQYWNEWAFNNNYILRWGTLYGDVEHPLYAGIWEKNSGNVAWSWDAGFYETLAEYQARAGAEIAQWTRPAFITVSSDAHQWSMFRDDVIGPWTVKSNLSSGDYQSAYQQLSNEGYYPAVVQGSGASADQARFTAIFVKQATPVARKWTITGRAVPALSAFDQIMQTYMQQRSIRACSLAIAKDGRLVLARAYTWSEPGYPITQPTSLFRTASCTKPFTSIAVHQLIQQGKLSLEMPMQQILNLKTPQGEPPTDPRFNTILIWHLLSHAGGWDRDATFDPLFYDTTVAKALGVQLPINKYQIAEYMAGQPLQFDPGSNAVYSNFGFSLLGQVIEKLTGGGFEQALQQRVYAPLGLTRPRLGHSLLAQQAPGEVRYHSISPFALPSVMSPAEPLVPYTYGGFSMENHDANGAQIMAAPDYARMLAAFDLADKNPLLQPAFVSMMWTHPPSLANKNILRGWFAGTVAHGLTVVGHDGYDPGTETVAFRRSDNTSFVVFFNHDFQESLAIDGKGTFLSNALSDAADGITNWPTTDLFPSVGIPSFPS
jgi:CubicO group peptidase (beta-lactamase class C family)